MNMFRCLLVPLDPQFQMRRALDVAASFAAEHGARITLLYVADLSSTFRYATFALLDQETIDRYNARIEGFLRNAASMLAEFDVAAETRIARGTPVSVAINATAAAIGADAIVMGTHGRKGLAHVWWGSVTEDVLRDATVPVIVVSAAKHTRSELQQAFSRRTRSARPPG
jgi:nucleotide-binding universal stress UspA family protein